MASSAYQSELEEACPEDWKVIPLTDAALFQEGPGILANDFHGSGVPLIRLKGVEGDFVTLDGCNFLAPEKVAGKWDHFRLKRGDLVISTSASFGRVSEVTEESEGAVPYTGLIRFRPKSSDIDARFLRAFLGSAVFMQQVEAMASGSVIRHFGPMHLKQMAMPCPPLSEQRVIGELSTLFAERLRNLRQINATLEAIAAALFKSWFVDFDCVVAEDMQESELGLIPKGWRVGTIKDVCSIHDSKRIPLSSAQRATRRGDYPYYGAAGVMDHVDDYLFDGIYVLVGEDGSVQTKDGYALTQYVWGKFWVNNHAHVLEGRDGYSTEQLLLALRRVLIGRYITGAVQPKLSQGNMWKIPVVIPTQQVKAKFSEIARSIFDAIRANTDQATTLTALRDTLLPRLISGRLRVRQ